MRGTLFVIVMAVLSAAGCLLSGCGYSSKSLYPSGISTVYVEMFDNKTFWRGQEYDLTDALCKMIEVRTPYRILSERDNADSIMSGYISSVEKGTLVQEPRVGRPLEQQMRIVAVVSWKNRRTGEMILDRVEVMAAADFSQFQGQSDSYASSLAANRLAESIVDMMREKW
ncbi:MAG TPA: LPS assembly lipoprotein LptE [Sedimentisphaerales bacterium]|nr:LPS assembly lipoprotein LptE [Sedimentisphaerales bacterium]